MTSSKGTIQGYNGIAINDDKHQIILQAQTCGSVGEQQTLQPAIEQLNQQLDKLNAAKNDDKSLGMTTRFTADSGFNSEDNLAFMSSSGFDTYIADTQFRSRNPLFKESETNHTEKEKRCLKYEKANQDSLPHKTFITINTIRPAVAQPVISCGAVVSMSRVTTKSTHDSAVI